MKKSKPRKPLRNNANRARKIAASKAAAIRKRKAASRKARTVRQHATPVEIAKFETEPVRKHANELCRDLRKEERELNQANAVSNKTAARVHERNMRKLRSEMRRMAKAIEALPLNCD